MLYSFCKDSYTEFHEKPANSLVDDTTHRHADGRTGGPQYVKNASFLLCKHT